MERIGGNESLTSTRSLIVKETIDIKHFVMCRRAEVSSDSGAFDAYHLSGVIYRFRVGTDEGMSIFDPLPISSIDLFARFYGGNESIDFEIELLGLDQVPVQGIEPCETFGPFTVYFRTGEEVRDFVFRLRNVPVFGQGQYSLTLYRVSGILEWEERDPLAIEYFEVIQL